jgi:hypothetical protein
LIFDDFTMEEEENDENNRNNENDEDNSDIFENIMEYYKTSPMNSQFSFHNPKNFAESEECWPFNCGMTTLFWYLMKTLHILGVNEIQVIST